MKKQKKRILIVTGMFALIILTVVVSYFIWNKKMVPNEPEFENVIMGIMPGIDLEERQKELQEELDNSMIAFSINTNPVFVDGLSEGNLLIENPGNNAKLLVVEIQLKNTNETIYTSKYIKSGSYLENIKLDKVLEKGTYSATAYFSAYNEETMEYIGKTGADITIIVQG